MSKTHPNKRSRVVIIGGGISGLSTAYYFSNLVRAKGLQDIDVTLLEKSPRLGGNIITEKTQGFLIEGGPDCFISDKPWAMALCNRLGLSENLLSTARPRGKTYVLHKGKLHLLPEGVILMVPTKMLPLLTSSLISLPGKIRMGLELFVPKKKGDKEESLAEFVRRRLGQEALDKIAEPLVAGVHAGDAETMSIKSSFPKFVELEEKYGSLIKGMIARMAAMESLKTAAPKGKGKVTMFMTLKGGLRELVDTLIEQSPGVDYKTGAAVTGIKKTGNGYDLTIEGKKKIHANALILNTPAYVTAELLKDVDLELSEKLKKIDYVSTATVSIGFKKKDIKHPMDGFGFVVPSIENRRITAASWSSVKWQGRSPDDSIMIRCFVGGNKKQELVELDDEAMEKLVREELKDIMGIDAEPVIVRVFRWRRSMPQYTIGHAGRIASIFESVANNPGLYITGSAYHGIGISDTVREAEVAAMNVLEFLD